MLARVPANGGEASAIRELEGRLATAIRTKDQPVLMSLTTSNFQISWSEGTAWDNISGKAGRKDWLDELTHLRTVSYQAAVSHIKVSRTQAFVDLQETWTVRTTNGTETRHFRSSDMWFKTDGSWKLAGRVSVAVQS